MIFGKTATPLDNQRKYDAQAARARELLRQLMDDAHRNNRHGNVGVTVFFQDGVIQGIRDAHEFNTK